MENIKNICRTCLKFSKRLQYLFDDTEIPHKIETIASVQVSFSDDLPSSICEQCVKNVHLLYDFRSIIIRSNSMLKERYARLKQDLETQSSDVKQRSSSELEIENKCDVKPTVADNLCEFTAETASSLITTVDTVVSENNDVKQHSSWELGIKNEYDVKATVIDNQCEFTAENSLIIVDTVMELKSKYNCKKCDFKSSDRTQWQEHKRTHVKVVKKVCCTVCGNIVRVTNIKTHMFKHVVSPVACKICGKICKHEESLRNHLLNSHTDVKLQCSICGKVYKHRTGLGKHMKRHRLGEAAKTVECSLCNKRFYDRRTLEGHKRSHTGEKPYPCEYCKKGFSTKYALTTHIRLHTNEKPFVCEFCPAAFPLKVSLKTHLKSKHPTENITL